MMANRPRKPWAFIAVLAGLLLSACGEELSVEQQVIASLESMEQSAEEGLHLDFMSYVANDFRGQYGGMDRREFHRFMIFQMSENRRLYAQLFPIRVKETDEGQAAAHFNILVTGGGGLLPDRGQLFEVKTAWIRDDGDWLLSEADWEPVNLAQR